MKNTCEVCNLPEELCVCNDDDFAVDGEEESASPEVNIYHGQDSGHQKTYIAGWESGNASEKDLQPILSDLQTRFGCGGTVGTENDTVQIVLHGRHPRQEVSEVLAGLDLSDYNVEFESIRFKSSY